MPDLERLPIESQDLVAALDRLIPARCIRPNETPEQAHRYAGKRELVEYLLVLAEEGRDTDNLLRT
jgi:hypothetical protein